MNNYNSLERLSNIFTLLASPQEDANIENISTALGIPSSIIEQDLQSLLKNETFQANTILVNDNSTSLSLDPNGFQFPYNTTPIVVSNSEKTLLNKYFPALSGSNQLDKTYHIKETPTVSMDSYAQLCNRIQLAIDNHYRVKFTYRSRNKKQLLNVTVEPHLLYHNINNGRIYLISIKNRIYTYRLDLILSLTELPQEKFISDYSKNQLEPFDYLWGMDLSSLGNPCHIKLRISAYNRNIIEKIKNDIARRKYAKLYQKGEYWYYEDDIIGLSAFKTWVYQFGYAVLVETPENLAREIYESALQRIENYSQNHF